MQRVEEYKFQGENEHKRWGENTQGYAWEKQGIIPTWWKAQYMMNIGKQVLEVGQG